MKKTESIISGYPKVEDREIGVYVSDKVDNTEESAADVPMPFQYAGIILIGFFFMSTFGILYSHSIYLGTGEESHAALKAVLFSMFGIAIGVLLLWVPFELIMGGAMWMFGILWMLGFIYAEGSEHCQNYDGWFQYESGKFLAEVVCGGMGVFMPMVCAGILCRKRIAGNITQNIISGPGYLSIICVFLFCAMRISGMAEVCGLTIVCQAWIGRCSVRRLIPLAGCLAIAGIALFVFDANKQVSYDSNSIDGWSPIMTAAGSVAHGGMLGTGVGNGVWPKETQESFKNTFLFSVIAQEMGGWGALIVLGLYTAFVFLGLHLAENAYEPQVQLVIAGLTVFIGVQSLGHICSSLALIPSTSLYLPFITAPVWGGMVVGIVGSALSYDGVRAAFNGVYVKKDCGEHLLRHNTRIRLSLIVLMVAMALCAVRLIVLATDRTMSGLYESQIEDIPEENELMPEKPDLPKRLYRLLPKNEQQIPKRTMSDHIAKDKQECYYFESKHSCDGLYSYDNWE